MLFHIQLAQEVFVLLLVRAVQLVAVLRPRVPNVRQPGFEWAMVVLLEGCPDPAAIIVPCDDDILDLQDLNCVLDHRKQVDIGWWGLISHVSMHEQLAWL